MNYKRELRSIKLDIISNNFDIKINPPKIGGFISFKPGLKIVKELLKCGAILTGSRALKCYTVSGKPILDRKADDWDFIVDEKTLFSICNKYNLSKFIESDGDNLYAKIEDEWVRMTSSYGSDTRLLSTNITLICKDDEPFIETNGYRITNLSSILDEKNNLSTDNNKHGLDLKQIITRFNSL